ncbi:MAG: M20 family metallopeptidase [Anaerovoracaceae bacterium]
MKRVEELKSSYREIIQSKRQDYENISDYIYNHPELGGEEFESSKFLGEVLRQEGFDVKFPYETLPTAFVAEYGTGEYTVATIAEYDALPGYGENGEPGHACGHNWIAAAMCGLGISLSKIAKELNIKVRVYGTPAEETFGAKVDMIKLGALEGVDLALQAHLDTASSVEAIALAMNSIEFTFKGKSAHAAAYPEKGINALDGVIAMFNGINAYREMTRDDARIHGIITKGGEAANIIPELCKCEISFRARDSVYVAKLRKRIIEIAEGAALISGTKLEYRDYENPFDDLINLQSLGGIIKRNCQAVGIDNFLDTANYPGAGSTDMGNISHACPTQYMEVEIGGGEVFAIHDEEAYRIANGEAAQNRLMDIIEGFGNSVIEIALDDELKQAIAKEHKDRITIA